MDDMDYMPGYDDGEWDPVMGDGDEWVETDNVFWILRGS
jgi:hypothetical protein